MSFINKIQESKHWEDFTEWYQSNYGWHIRLDDWYCGGDPKTGFINLPFEFQKGVFEKYIKQKFNLDVITSDNINNKLFNIENTILFLENKFRIMRKKVDGVDKFYIEFKSNFFSWWTTVTTYETIPDPYVFKSQEVVVYFDTLEDAEAYIAEMVDVKTNINSKGEIVKEFEI